MRRNSIKINPPAPARALTAEECLRLGLGYLEHARLAEALVALEQAQKSNPNTDCANRIGLAIHRIYQLAYQQPVPQEIGEAAQAGTGALVGLIDELSLHLCKKDYLAAFKKIQDDHHNMIERFRMEKNEKQLLLMQMEWILTLITFIETNHIRVNGHYGMTEPAFIANDEQGQRLRLRHLANVYATHIINPNYAGSHAALFEAVVHNMIPGFEDTLRNSDAKNILGKIFETIHQLPRNRRGEWIDLLPWGSNSWYLMDFCVSFFKDDNAITSGSDMVFVIEDSHSPELHPLENFEQSSHHIYQFIDAGMTQIIREDVPKMREFFVALKNNIATDGASPTITMQNLTNIEPLVWFFKHTFQYLKLNNLLPFRTDLPIKHLRKALVKEAGNLEMVMTPLIKHNLLTQQHTPGTLGATLKSRLSLIRNLQLIGEMFCTRNWGSQLKEIDYFDYETLTIIRDGLCHIEDLISTAGIEQLEQTTLMMAIYQEWHTLRNLINDAIIARQQHFPVYPKEPQDFENYLLRTWQEIQRFYQHRIAVVANRAPFIPNQALLPPADQAKALGYVNPDRQEYVELGRMLRGEIPFTMPNCQDIANGTGKSLKTNRKKLKSLLMAAKNKYNELTRAHVKDEAAKKAAREAEKQATLNSFMQTKFPNLRQAAALIKQSWAVAVPNNLSGEDKKIAEDQNRLKEAEYAVTCLQNRVRVLNKLINEASFKPSPGDANASKNLQILLLDDVELLFSCQYLIAQIISIMNKLSSFHLLDKISPELEAKLDFYVSLRNALEHTDAVLDSEKDLFFHMRNDLHAVMADFVVAMMTQHEMGILAVMAPQFIEQHALVLGAIKERHKQTQALDIQGASSPVQHRKKFGLFPGQDIHEGSAVLVKGVLYASDANQSSKGL